MPIVLLPAVGTQLLNMAGSVKIVHKLSGAWQTFV